jgi:hypothetical protein
MTDVALKVDFRPLIVRESFTHWYFNVTLTPDQGANFMRVLAFISGFFAMAVVGTAAQADWMNPTSGRDCQDGLQELFQQREMLRVNERQCEYSQTEDYWAGRVQYRTFLCGDLPRHQGVYTLETCSQEAQAICNVGLEIPRRRALCQSRLADYRTRQAALRAQQEEAERLQSEQERIARASGQSLTGPTVMDRYGILPSGPGNLANDSRVAGERVAQMMGARMTADRGAYTLSSAVTRVGNRIIGRMNERALGDLEAALGEFSASNPRPTAGQLEEFYGQRADLAAQYAAHMTRVQNTDYRLPLGDESAVVGAYADAIIQLVEMRNAGEIDEPIAVLGAAAATVLAVRAYREAEERAAEARLSIPRPSNANDLRSLRQAALQPVADERTRIREAARRAEEERLARLAREEEIRRQQREWEETQRQIEIDRARRDAEFAAWQAQQRRLEQERIARQQRLNTMIGIIGGVVQGLNGGSGSNSNDCAHDMRVCGRCGCELGRGGP